MQTTLIHSSAQRRRRIFPASAPAARPRTAPRPTNRSTNLLTKLPTPLNCRPQTDKTITKSLKTTHSDRTISPKTLDFRLFRPEEEKIRRNPVFPGLKPLQPSSNPHVQHRSKSNTTERHRTNRPDPCPIGLDKTQQAWTRLNKTEQNRTNLNTSNARSPVKHWRSSHFSQEKNSAEQAAERSPEQPLEHPNTEPCRTSVERRRKHELVID